jgi:hypothetical protein
VDLFALGLALRMNRPHAPRRQAGSVALRRQRERRWPRNEAAIDVEIVLTVEPTGQKAPKGSDAERGGSAAIPTRCGRAGSSRFLESAAARRCKQRSELIMRPAAGDRCEKLPAARIAGAAIENAREQFQFPQHPQLHLAANASRILSFHSSQPAWSQASAKSA